MRQSLGNLAGVLRGLQDALRLPSSAVAGETVFIETLTAEQVAGGPPVCHVLLPESGTVPGDIGPLVTQRIAALTFDKADYESLAGAGRLSEALTSISSYDSLDTSTTIKYVALVEMARIEHVKDTGWSYTRTGYEVTYLTL